jgi:hypothetical protein
MTPPEMAKARVTAALADVEAAQGKLDDAAQALAAVRGFVREYDRVLKLCTAVQAAWHEVELRRRKLVAGAGLVLDHDELTVYELGRWGGPGCSRP